MKAADLEHLAKLLKEQSGLVVTAEKAYLLENRLQPVARKWGMDSIDALVGAMRARADHKMIKDVVDAMTTNESLFFRDMKPFDNLRDILLPELMKTRAASKRIRIWSAACSSGQEPYSIAMLLTELGAKVAGWRFEIVATDLSTEIITRAKQGTYSQFEVQRGLPITMLVKYFAQEGDKWRISDKIRNMVQYREFNLLDHPRMLGQFDIVFCRNVLIYFDQPTKTKVLAGIADQMAPDGGLYLGGAETVLGITDRFEPIPGQRGVYRISQKTAVKATA
ncbi:protein-glutamate O-methyltransferase [Thalassobaculum sp. OXR-137]|uniref:CheR family methyltransferase n=1 Tax=Thalassobaculum sp. OXR-137 TaxID=3100173 RepID=UPI002AC9BBFF|nr:protein-glutamate O-methyltransferase [Thalassobaculum sp. OXR-137]WPZ37082.1 protein-glutamate O-methyltransferase [Thalassobaculum sp. OXR-137]